MTLIRIRLCFARSLIKKSEQCWMLVDTKQCKLVQDLEYMIRKKFFMDEECFILNLYLDDFLLPSQEKIEVIRDNDVISVKEEYLLLSKKNKISKSNVSLNPKKRKLDQGSDDSKNKNKKIKHSSPSKSPAKTETNVKKTKNLNKKHKSKTSNFKNHASKTKCQKAAAFLHKVSQDVTKIFSGSRMVDNSNGPKNICEDQNTVINTLNGATSDKPKRVSTTKAASLSRKAGQSNRKTKLENKKAENIKQRTGTGNVNGNIKKTNSKNSKALEGSSSSDSSTTSSETVSSATTSSSDSADDKKKPVNQQTAKHVNIPQILNKKDNAEFAVQKQHKVNGLVASSQGNHIRFDDTESQGTPQPRHLPPPNILRPVSNPQVTKNIHSNSPHLSPIHPISKNNNNTNQNKNKNSNKKTQPGKDIYTNKSKVLESTRMHGKSIEEPVETGASNDVPDEDFTKYPLLHGPPRVGEIVAYKVLEISQSYTPEISNYKKGKVLAFNAATNQLKIKLTKGSLSRAKGDGHVSTKFELFDNDENAEEPLPVPEETTDEVEVQWSAMVQPRLIAPGILKN